MPEKNVCHVATSLAVSLVPVVKEVILLEKYSHVGNT